MNKFFLTVFTIGIILTVMAFSNSDDQSEGAIGDVKYSVLPPDKFQEKNGKGWVLMDDKIPLNGSDLADEGIIELPDARGLFIRGLNLTRNDDKADPFFKENKRQRTLGEIQNDTIKHHKHDMTQNVGPYNGWSGGWGGVGGIHPVHSPSEHGQIVDNKEFGGEETRPKNIALYTYIKINE